MNEYERYHYGQYLTPYESTAALADFIRSVTGETKLRGTVHDVGCGAGSVIYWLDKWDLTKDCVVRGIDMDARLLQAARDNNPDRDFLKADFRDPLPVADVSLSVQGFSFIEDWRPALRECLASTRIWLFASSLFWPGVDTHTHASDKEKSNVHYNVISTEAFESACKRGGAKVEAWRPFVASKPIVAPKNMLRSRTEGGHTISGPLYMPWQFVAVRKT